MPQASDLVFFHISAVQSAEGPAAASGGEAAGSEKGAPAKTAEAADAGTAAALEEHSGSEQQQPDQAQGDSGRKKDLSELLQPGDPVEFVVAASSHDAVRHKGNRPPKLMGTSVSLP